MARIKVASLNVPQTKPEAAVMISRMGIIQSQLERIQADAAEEVAVAQEKAAIESAPLTAELNELAKAVAAFNESNWDELTSGSKTKTVKYPSGAVSRRFTPPKTSLKNVEAVIAQIRKKRWAKRFLRIKVEVNREALLADPVRALQIDGVSIGRREELVITPGKGEEIVAKSVKITT